MAGKENPRAAKQHDQGHTMLSVATVVYHLPSHCLSHNSFRYFSTRFHSYVFTILKDSFPKQSWILWTWPCILDSNMHFYPTCTVRFKTAASAIRFSSF